MDESRPRCKTTPVALPIVGLDHVVLRTMQLEKILAFYRDALGCPMERTIERIGLYQMRAGTALIDVIDGKGSKAGAGPGETLYDHFCIQIASSEPDAVLAELDRHEIPHGDPTERYGASGHGISIYTTDPDGRTVELKLVGKPSAP